jgi:hypothetical protein
MESHQEICEENPYIKKEQCRYCDYTGRKDNVRRHEETACKEKKRIQKLEEKLYDMMIEKDRLKDELLKQKDIIINSKDEIITCKDETITCKNETINSKDETISAYKNSHKEYAKLSGSIIKFLMKYFNDAPELTFDINEFDFNRDIMAGILQDDSRKKLINYVSVLIIKHYKKNDPKLQSLWGIDKNRLHYVNRQKDDENNITWTNDCYGEFIKQRIIRPLIRAISNSCVENIEDIIQSPFIMIDNDDERTRTKEISLLQQKAFLIEDPTILDELTTAVFKKVSKNFIFDRYIIKKYTKNEEEL